MGIINDILNSLIGSGSNDTGVHHSSSVKEHEDGTIRVREAAYITDNETGKHSTIWSNTDSNIKTGETSIKEGGHGENYHK